MTCLLAYVHTELPSRYDAPLRQSGLLSLLNTPCLLSAQIVGVPLFTPPPPTHTPGVLVKRVARRGAADGGRREARKWLARVVALQHVRAHTHSCIISTCLRCTAPQNALASHLACIAAALRGVLQYLAQQHCRDQLHTLALLTQPGNSHTVHPPPPKKTPQCRPRRPGPCRCRLPDRDRHPPAGRAHPSLNALAPPSHTKNTVPVAQAWASLALLF